MNHASLICHRNTPTDVVENVDIVAQRASNGGLHFRYTLHGNLGRIALPEVAPPHHTDGLWHHTCFEAFIATEDGSAYIECNFSPSGSWAAYRFSGYRSGMKVLLPAASPSVASHARGGVLTLDAQIQLAEAADGPLRLGIAAVIEERDGRHTYWALRHPRARPDFHHRAGFILRLTT